MISKIFLWIIVDFVVSLDVQQEYSTSNSEADRCGAESCRERPALKVQGICDTAKRQGPTPMTSASLNKGQIF